MNKPKYLLCFLDHRPRWNISWRVLLALFGGYGVAWLSAASMALGLPLSRVDAVSSAIMLAFVIHLLIVIWVFAAATVIRATMGVGLAAAAFFGWWWLARGTQ